VDIQKIKWLSSLLAALIIGIIEFVRHQFLHVISMDWGNLIVAAATGVLVLVYFQGVFALLENLYKKLQREREETAVLEERYRIARDLHDNVAQTLFFLHVKINEVEKSLQEQGAELAAVGEIKEAIKMTDEDIRKYIFILQNDVRDQVILLAAIRSYSEKYQEINGIKVKLEVIGDIENSLSQTVKSRIVSIFQELLANVRKHAAADQVYVKLALVGEEFSLRVSDYGTGFVKKTKEANRLSFGLKNIEADVRAIGGTLNVMSTLGAGTTVVVSLHVTRSV
jgi:signal transduction histidine kinase